MKKSVQIILFISIIAAIFLMKDDISNFISNFINNQRDKNIINKITIPESNEYKKNNTTYSYLKNVDNYIPSNKEDLKNIIYTILNNGFKEFTFYCPSSYTNCIDDVTDLTNDEEILSNINNFVSPFNSFKTIETTYSSDGEITLVIHKLYDNDTINKVNDKVRQIINENITDNMSNEEKIKVIHDYVINNTKYDSEKIGGVTKYKSNTAYGALIEGYAICSGYADTMAIFLDNLGIENYKIASSRHVWNLVNINGEWKHLDLTFDDPVTSSGEDMLLTDYFLIDTTTLKEKDNVEHYFDEKIYVESL